MAKKTSDDNMWKKSEDSFVHPDELHDMIDLADQPEADAVGDPAEYESDVQQSQPAGDLADKLDAALRGWLRSLPGFFAVAWLWLQRCGAAVGNALYEVGYYAEYALVRAGRAIKRGSVVAAKWLGRSLLWLLKILLWLPVAIAKLLLKPFYHLYRGARTVYDIWYTRDPDKPGETWKKTFVYLGGGAVRNAHLIPDILGWLLPIAACAVFVFTVQTVMDYQYVLQVSFDDKVLGYVASDTVVEEAQRDVKRRIIYTNEDEAAEEWDIVPHYSLAVNEGVTVLNADQVADAILKNSGKDIVEATGFYLGGVFYGATTDGEALAAELEAIKAPYATGAEGEYLSFVVEPELVEGVYLRSSVVAFEKLKELLHSQVAGEVRYTVVSGDTPSGIAHAHNLTTDELVAMNADRDILKNLYPGDSLLVSQAVSFLQVKVTYRRTELESIPFETQRTTTPDLSFGFTKVTVQGVNGTDECVYDYMYIDGVLQSKTLVSRVTITPPVTQQILVGTTIRPGETMVPATGGYQWPIPGFRGVSRGFTGAYAHNGIDITGAVGTPIYASQRGVVTRAVYGRRGYGIYVVVDHGGGWSTLYGHCNGLAVGVGDIVEQGDLIAYLGNTGNSTGPHCHFELRTGNTRIDPAPYVGYG